MEEILKQEKSNGLEKRLTMYNPRTYFSVELSIERINPDPLLRYFFEDHKTALEFYDSL